VQHEAAERVGGRAREGAELGLRGVEHEPELALGRGVGDAEHRRAGDARARLVDDAAAKDDLAERIAGRRGRGRLVATGTSRGSADGRPPAASGGALAPAPPATAKPAGATAPPGSSARVARPSSSPGRLSTSRTSSTPSVAASTVPASHQRGRPGLVWCPVMRRTPRIARPL
jgi:hypothetical protein